MKKISLIIVVMLLMSVSYAEKKVSVGLGYPVLLGESGMKENFKGIINFNINYPIYCIKNINYKIEFDYILTTDNNLTDYFSPTSPEKDVELYGSFFSPNLLMSYPLKLDKKIEIEPRFGLGYTLYWYTTNGYDKNTAADFENAMNIKVGCDFKINVSTKNYLYPYVDFTFINRFDKYIHKSFNQIYLITFGLKL